jgi:hypothetical protein
MLGFNIETKHFNSNQLSIFSNKKGFELFVALVRAPFRICASY